MVKVSTVTSFLAISDSENRNINLNDSQTKRTVEIFYHEKYSDFSIERE